MQSSMFDSDHSYKISDTMSVATSDTPDSSWVHAD